MNDATDSLTIKANLTLSKEEIIEHIVDMEMDLLRMERDKVRALADTAKQEADTAQLRFNTICAKLQPSSLLELDQQAALDKFREAFKMNERQTVCVTNLTITGKFLSAVVKLMGEDGFHLQLHKLVNVPMPSVVQAAFDGMVAKRLAHQEAQQVYSLAASKCDGEAVDELKKAIKHRLVDNLFKEINGSLQKLLAAPTNE